MSDAAFARAKAFLNGPQGMDLVTLSGTYVTVAMLLATGHEKTTDGSAPRGRRRRPRIPVTVSINPG